MSIKGFHFRVICWHLALYVSRLVHMGPFGAVTSGEMTQVERGEYVLAHRKSFGEGTA